MWAMMHAQQSYLNSDYSVLEQKGRHAIILLFGFIMMFDTGGGGGGGTDLERGYGDVRPWRPPFHTSLAAHKGPISSKRVSSQDPLLRKFGNFSLYSLNFHPNFSSQAPKFGNFQLTSPQIWKFSSHKPPFSEANVSLQAPHFGNPCLTPLPEKKVECPPPGVWYWHVFAEFLVLTQTTSVETTGLKELAMIPLQISLFSTHAVIFAV